MTLPRLPFRSGDDRRDLEALYNWAQNVIDTFPSSVGEAIDPVYGQGGDRSLSIIDAPTGITYVPNSDLAVDGTLFGYMDITYTLPARAVAALVHYRETGILNWKTSLSTMSPWRLPNLKVGIEYDVAIAGLAANNSIGPLSDIEMVTIPTDALGDPDIFEGASVADVSTLAKRVNDLEVEAIFHS